MPTQSKPTTPTTRKTYTAPILQEYGLVKELTHTSALTNGPDGGGFPNIYNSIPA